MTHYTMDITTSTGSEVQSKIANSATSGIPYISQGTASNQSGTALSQTALTNAEFANNSVLYISGFYKAS